MYKVGVPFRNPTIALREVLLWMDETFDDVDLPRRGVTHLITKSGSRERLVLEAPENARLGGEEPVSLWLDGDQTPLRLIETCRTYAPGRARSGTRFSIGIGVAGFGGGGDRDRRPRAQNPSTMVGRQPAPSTRQA